MQLLSSLPSLVGSTGVASVIDVVGVTVGHRYGWPVGCAGWPTAGIRW